MQWSLSPRVDNMWITASVQELRQHLSLRLSNKNAVTSLRLSNKNVTQKQWHYEKLANCCTFQEGGPQFAGCREKPQDGLGGRSLKRKSKRSEY